MKHILFSSIILGAVLLSGMKNVYAQNWQQVTLPYNYGEATPYFLNEKIGFVFAAKGNRFNNPPTTHLAKTTTGGSTWTYISYFDDINCIVQQLYFISLTQGYAAGSTGVFETIDGGITWQRIYQGTLFFNSVYAAGNKVFAIAGTPATATLCGPLISTEDNGAHWDTIIAGKLYSPTKGDHLSPYVFGNKDSLVIAESVDNTGLNLNLNYSTDNGKSWSSNTLDVSFRNASQYTIGIYCFPHCTDILRTVLNSSRDRGPIEHSTNYGKTWTALVQDVEIGAWVAGNNCVLYTSNANGSLTTGPLRSQNRGNIWIYTGGPNFSEIDDYDFHNMSVVGGGAVLYTCDRFGSFWKTTNGGDGKLSAKGFATHIGLSHTLSSGGQDTLIALPCSPSSIQIIHENLSCNYAHLDSLSITGLSPGEYTTSLTHHLACDGIPDTLLIMINSLVAGMRDISIHEQFINDEYQTVDTDVAVTMISQAGPTNLKLSYDLSTGSKDTLSIGFCDSASIKAYFENLFCSFAHLQSITIDSLFAAEYRIFISKHLPQNFLPDTVQLMISPIVTGTRTVTIHARFKNNDQIITDTSMSFVVKSISPGHADIYLKTIRLSALPADTINIPVFINSSTPQISVQPNLDSVNLDYALNTDLLTPIAFLPSVAWIAKHTMKSSEGYTTIGMKFSPGFSFTGETELGKIKCVVYLSDTVETGITLSGNVLSSGCLSFLTATEAPFILSNQCGDSTLSHFMKYSKSFEILSIVPNPAGNNVKVQLKNNEAELKYELFNVLGIKSKSGMTNGNSFGIDLSGLPDGNYYLRLNGKGGIPVTKQLVIAR